MRFFAHTAVFRVPDIISFFNALQVFWGDLTTIFLVVRAPPTVHCASRCYTDKPYHRHRPFFVTSEASEASEASVPSVAFVATCQLLWLLWLLWLGGLRPSPGVAARE